MMCGPRSTAAAWPESSRRARYVLNPRMKHDPTLMDPDETRRAARLDFLFRAVDVAKALGAESVSLWSGRAPMRLLRVLAWIAWLMHFGRYFTTRRRPT